ARAVFRVCHALAALTAQGRVHKTAAGYQLTASSERSGDQFPATSLHGTGKRKRVTPLHAARSRPLPRPAPGLVVPGPDPGASLRWGIGLRWRATRAPRRTRAGRRAGADT